MPSSEATTSSHTMLTDMPPLQEPLSTAIHDYVLHHAPLAVYDPLQPQRPRAQVVSFTIEYLDLDDGIAHAAGPVVLKTPAGDVEQHLRITVPVTADGQIDDTAFRAAYIVETNPETGSCKETAALANC